MNFKDIRIIRHRELSRTASSSANKRAHVYTVYCLFTCVYTTDSTCKKIKQTPLNEKGEYSFTVKLISASYILACSCRDENA